MWTNPIHTGFVGNIQGGEAIQLQMVDVPRCPDLVSERDRKSIEGEPIRLEWFCDWDDNLYHTS